MNRRQLLVSSAALGLLPATAFANPDTFKRFHAALERDPTLAVFADTVGERAGDASVKGRMPAASASRTCRRAATRRKSRSTSSAARRGRRACSAPANFRA